MSKVLIIDGHNYLYRAYYGIPSSAKLPSGLQVNAFYGFISSLRKVVKHIDPKYIITVFDSESGIKNKTDKNIDYKSNRDYHEKGMFVQLPLIKKALDYMNISWIEDSHYEADDIIGSIASKEYKLGNMIFISSQDKDFFQLIKDRVRICRFEKGNIVNYTSNYFKRIYGFECNRYIEYLSMVGDRSDNVKGIKGIGNITATKLIKENINLDSIDNKLIKDNISIYYDNKIFLKINANLKLQYILNDVDWNNFNLKSNEIISEII